MPVLLVYGVCIMEIKGVSLDAGVDSLPAESLTSICRALKLLVNQIGMTQARIIGSVTGRAFRTLLVPPPKKKNKKTRLLLGLRFSEILNAVFFFVPLRTISCRTGMVQSFNGINPE
ncbi:hypothetical protein SERLA73DRAFT_182461 [Serpula lacrymans var. lacrymans S7.3]|uniref:Uncharacterized protein n=1 Tax=Serpula lacrymans var. lacrymans (strain S7.3) TaxID=936435 RepID=F8PXG8_SERL3|nr:hypothetical protein SERLA73DRAFT_182461 [Serpula lacrymans var. lacrymans S7.3]